MANLVDLDFNPDRKTLRQFGWIALVGFGLLAAAAWYEVLIFGFGLGQARVPVAAGLAGLGFLGAFFSLVAPGANKILYVGLAVVAFPIGFVLSWVIMGTLYFVLITPIGLFMKLIGRDTLHRSYDPNAQTYWSDARPERASTSYFKQF